MNILNLSANNSAKKLKYVAPKVKVVPFKDLKLGREINSGISSTVYNIKGFKSIVARTNFFDPENLKWDVNPITKKILSSSSTIIMERVAGKPLYGKHWSVETKSFLPRIMQLLELLQVPDKAYTDYIDKVLNIRRNKYDIDLINPNNILYDKKKQEFNIIDLEKKEDVEEKVSIEDFSPFWDGEGLDIAYGQANRLEQFYIFKLAQKLINKIINAAKQKGVELKIENVSKYYHQKPHVYIYHNDKDRFDKVTNVYKCLRNG
ncbi:MAG: hypothetical protein E7Z89_03375 [Cyanobacteria bacterium SIG28]|nr:hypothetical protein [Cyanobacteria bacterium SIG28]